jgi:DNA-directed RNA polymerase specialized sigma24 family protein
MPSRRRGLGVRDQIDRELDELEERRGRLLAARAALDGEALVAKPKAPRFSRAQISDHLREHPGSTYTEVAEGLGAPATNVAQHLSRGQKAGAFRSEDGRWSLVEE